MDNVTVIFPDLYGQKEIDGVKVIAPYKLQRFIVFRLLRILSLKMGLKSFLINKSKIRKAKGTIIVFDVITQQFVNWLEKNKKDRRIIFWYWNPVESSRVQPINVPSSFEKWSYSKSDCRKYGFKWNSTFATPKLMKFPTTSDNCFDAIFIGRNKGRTEVVRRLCEIIRDSGYKSEMIITKNKFIDPKNRSLHKLLSYEEYLRLESKSQAIIDFGPNKDAGLTLRSLEMLYLDKKLICDYYEVLDSKLPKDRILFVKNIEEMSRDEIVSFFERKPAPIQEDVLSYYSFRSWLERFGL